MAEPVSVSNSDILEGLARKKPFKILILYDRKLLADLSRCAWESLKVFLQEAVPEKDPVPGAVIAVQTFGDLIGHNPHCHILVTDGCFLRQAQDDVYGNKGMFRVAPPLELKKLEAIFQGVQDAPEQGKDHEGDDRHALNMAAFRIPRLLRQPHLARRGNGYGEPGPLHHPGVWRGHVPEARRDRNVSPE